MTEEKKPNEPELIEDEALDEASGGLLPAVKTEPQSLKIQPASLKIQQKVAPVSAGEIKLGDGSV